MGRGLSVLLSALIARKCVNICTWELVACCGAWSTRPRAGFSICKEGLSLSSGLSPARQTGQVSPLRPLNGSNYRENEVNAQRLFL